MVMQAQARRAALGASVLVGGWILAGSGPSVADVTAVRGEAYGYFSSVSLFGGPPGVRGPAPVVTLPPGGSATPVTATVAESIVQYGPAILFSSGPITVSTQGTTGPAGSVTSSADVQNVNRSGQELFTASSVSSTCTATEAGVSGSTTVNNGTVQTSEGNPNVDCDEVVVNVPVNPPPNYTVNGQIEGVGDSFQYIFNEQIVGPDGSITVNAVHLRLLGPTAVGDLYVGQSECGVTATGTGTTTTTTSSSTTIVGTAGTDTIVGTPGPDVIVGLGGDDRISGLGGDDVICGGDGNDSITGGEGNDTILGGPGNDDLVGDAGNDTLNGEAGTNLLSGGDGTDTCTNGAAAGCP
jgi:Ca2+-binding RTX toxin-like protein